ncbi:hypothetical protein ABTJ98_21165, partial [Acinetobacter baumannii]
LEHAAIGAQQSLGIRSGAPDQPDPYDCAPLAEIAVFAHARSPNRPHIVKSTLPSPEDPTAMLAALGELAALCGQALEAASVG